MAISYTLRSTPDGVPTSVTVTVKFRPHTINASDYRFNKVLDKLKQDCTEDEIIEIIDLKETVSKSTAGLLEVRGSRLFAQDREIPASLAKPLFTRLNMGLDILPYEKFILRVLENPSFRSVQQLAGFLENAKLPITEDGHFIAYKRVTSGYKDCHTAKIDNRVGQIPHMPRNMVNDDPNQTCSYGYHVCSYEYLSHFSGSHTMACKIDPADVVSVPIDYNNAKMRVCRYEVVGEIPDDRIREDNYFTSPDYDEFSELDPFKALEVDNGFEYVEEVDGYNPYGTPGYRVNRGDSQVHIPLIGLYGVMKDNKTMANAVEAVASNFQITVPMARGTIKAFLDDKFNDFEPFEADVNLERPTHETKVDVQDNDDETKYFYGSTKIDFRIVSYFLNHPGGYAAIVMVAYHYGLTFVEAADICLFAEDQGLEDAYLEDEEDEEDEEYDDEDDWEDEEDVVDDDDEDDEDEEEADIKAGEEEIFLNSPQIVPVVPEPVPIEEVFIVVPGSDTKEPETELTDAPPADEVDDRSSENPAPPTDDITEVIGENPGPEDKPVVKPEDDDESPWTL
jgi:hypothetical protein